VEDAASAQQNLASAQAAYDKLVNPDSNDVLALKSDIDKSKAVLAQAQAAYDRAGGDANPFIAQTPQSLQLQSATLDYQKALALYNSKLNPSNAQIQQALATIQSAKSQIARLQPVAEDLSAAKASVQAAQAARDLATERLNEAKIIAPFNATVIKIDLEKGGFVSAGRPVITVADLHKLRVTINIDETDIPRVQVGLPVDLDFDAFPNVKLTGHVTELAPSATIVQGVVNYGVKVTLDPSDTPIRLGMTVNANIQVAKKENVLLVPNRAIRATNNRRVVSIYDGVALHDSELKLGLSNDQETEVISGLEEGQRVVVTALPATIPGFGR
jgi:HlyD family secretion protein